jgi:hypothetical protein
MAKFKVSVMVEAPDVMMAGLATQGVQNVLNELGEHQAFLIELADPIKAKDYKNKIMGLINNPVIKKLAGSFGG